MEEFLLGLDHNLERLRHTTVNWFSAHTFNVLVILFGAWLVRKFGAELISRILQQTIRSDLYPTQEDREKRLKTLDSLVGAFMRIAVYIVAAIMIVSELGLDTAPLLASAGVLGVALGFGAQSMVKDFTTGVFIIAENQYRVGDTVGIGDVVGTVELITLRTTILRDDKGYVHHVPNGTITVTTNRSMAPKNKPGSRK